MLGSKNLCLPPTEPNWRLQRSDLSPEQDDKNLKKCKRFYSINSNMHSFIELTDTAFGTTGGWRLNNAQSVLPQLACGVMALFSKMPKEPLNQHITFKWYVGTGNSRGGTIQKSNDNHTGLTPKSVRFPGIMPSWLMEKLAIKIHLSLWHF